MGLGSRRYVNKGEALISVFCLLHEKQWEGGKFFRLLHEKQGEDVNSFQIK